MVRRMAEVGFRGAQERDRYASHVRPINQLVDGLRDRDGRGWIPHVAPWHGGVEAAMLSVLRDPGPMVREGVGSGFLCIENDDPTAESQCHAFEAVGIAAGDLTPWNAYPWYINRAPGPAELEAGVEPLVALIGLMPRLRVVLLQGQHAQSSWRRLNRRHPELMQANQLTVVSTYHPSRQALWSADPAVRQTRIQHRLAAYRQAADAVHRHPSH
jgi:hypothetical protein